MNHAVVTLDETGSMRGQEERVVSALNQYVNALPKDTDLTVFKFDSKRWVTQFAGIAKDWKPLTLKDYRPGASTPLYDAIAWTIHHAESLASDGDKVVVVIDTDGRENSSREFDHAACQRMIRDKKEDRVGVRVHGKRHHRSCRRVCRGDRAVSRNDGEHRGLPSETQELRDRIQADALLLLQQTPRLQLRRPPGMSSTRSQLTDDPTETLT